MRTLVHILFNVAGVLLWVMFIDQLADFVSWFSPSHPELAGVERLGAETPRQIANAHTIFNLANTLIFIGFTTQLARLVDGPLQQGDDVGHGVEGDGLELAHGTDVTAMAGTPASAAGLAALGGELGVVLEAVGGPADGVGVAGGTFSGRGLAFLGGRARGLGLIGLLVHTVLQRGLDP